LFVSGTGSFLRKNFVTSIIVIMTVRETIIITLFLNVPKKFFILDFVKKWLKTLIFDLKIGILNH
jgi:hypothetical protein